MYTDPVDSQEKIAVANLGNNSITIHRRNDATPHLLHAPRFINPRVQQQLLVSYLFKGAISRTTGLPLPPTDPATGLVYENDPITGAALTNVIGGQRLPIPLLQGYSYVLKVTDALLKTGTDVNTAFLLPPGNTQFHLADGSDASNLIMSCPAFTPFIIDEVTTNCLGQALIISPFPAQPEVFRIAASVVHQTENISMTPNIAPLVKSTFPLVKPQVELSPSGAIIKIKWSYVDASGQQLTPPAPLITSQSFSMTYTKDYNEISTCYLRRVNPKSAFSSGSMTPDVRSEADINDSGCDMFLKDVSNISFSLLDAYDTRYVYSWNVVD